MDTGVVKAISLGDVATLRALLLEDPSRAERALSSGEGGKHLLPPLHLVCDAVFRKEIDGDRGLALAKVLLEAGVDPNRAYAKSGDTYLIAAASLGAERVGLELVERGADVGQRGLFGATALHWAALMGLDRLSTALVRAGGNLELRDERYDCTPLQWALHAWSEGTQGDRARLPRVVADLVAFGARVPPDALQHLQGEDDAAMRDALLPSS